MRVNVDAVRRSLAICGVLSGLLLPASASGDGASEVSAPTRAGGADTLSPDARIEIAPEPPVVEGVEAPSDASPSSPAAIAEAPPPRPRRKGLVLESTLGALGFAGQFRRVAAPGTWLHAQLGYEVLSWLMLFGEAELAFTDDAPSQDASHVMAFPLYGFGGGARATVHASSRFAVFGQGEIDAMAADVPHESLGILGFRKAESLSPSFGARLGVEWYQTDRHLALSAQLGVRDASGFAKAVASSDIPIMWDAAAGLRYTF